MLPAEAHGLMGNVVEVGLKVDILQVALVYGEAWRHTGSTEHKLSQTEGRAETAHVNFLNKSIEVKLFFVKKQLNVLLFLNK